MHDQCYRRFAPATNKGDISVIITGADGKRVQAAYVARIADDRSPWRFTAPKDEKSVSCFQCEQY
jgi:hypothetical protein